LALASLSAGSVAAALPFFSGFAADAVAGLYAEIKRMVRAHARNTTVLVIHFIDNPLLFN
jgi:hypothetical protein